MPGSLSLPRFYELFPHSEIFLEERPTYQLRTMLEEEQFDLIIDVPHPDSLNYHNIVLAQEHLVLAVPEAYIKELPEISPEAHVVTMDPSKVTEEVVPMQCFAELPFFMLAEPQNLTALSRRIYESAGFRPQGADRPVRRAHPRNLPDDVNYFNSNPSIVRSSN